MMKEKEFKENLEAAKQILDGINIPGKKDSMLAAAKTEHIERLGGILNNILIQTRLAQHEIDDVVTDFKKQYKNTFLKFIQKEGD